jgi:hypothetical protein
VTTKKPLIAEILEQQQRKYLTEISEHDEENIEQN